MEGWKETGSIRRKSSVGCSPRVYKDSDRTERLTAAAWEKNTSEMFLGAWELKCTLSKSLHRYRLSEFQIVTRPYYLNLTISLTSPLTSLPFPGLPQVSHAWQIMPPGWGIWVPVPVTWNSFHLDVNITHLPPPTSQLKPSLDTYQNCKILKHTRLMDFT